jgi:hypothetical protein
LSFSTRSGFKPLPGNAPGGPRASRLSAPRAQSKTWIPFPPPGRTERAAGSARVDPPRGCPMGPGRATNGERGRCACWGWISGPAG